MSSLQIHCELNAATLRDGIDRLSRGLAGTTPLGSAESLLKHVGRHGGFSYSVSVKTEYRPPKGLGVVAISGNTARFPRRVEHLLNPAQFIRGERSLEIWGVRGS